MKNLKMMTAIMLLLCMALSLCACTAEPATTTTAAKVPAATTTVPATTQQPTEPTSDGKVDYTITVLNPDGTPAVEAWIMVCDADKCMTPKCTDANGVVVFRLEQKDGKLWAYPIRGKSGLITTLAGAEGYFCIVRDCEGLPQGAEIQVTVTTGA